MAQNDVDIKVRLMVDSKTYNAALRQANKEAKEFKKQQASSFKGVEADISGAFGKAIGVVGKLAPALSASAAAMAVAKKAMEENQTLTDSWARTTESAKASWEGFVDALVHADFGNYFSNIDSIIRRAADAADAIDRLDTTRIFTSRMSSEYDLAIRKARIVIKDPSSTAEERQAAGVAIEKAQDQQLASVQRLSDEYMRAFATKLADYVTRKGFPASESDFVEQGADGRWRAKTGSLFEKYFGDLPTYELQATRYEHEQAARGKVIGVVPNPYGGTPIYSKGEIPDAEFAELRAFMELSDAKLREVFDLFKAANQEEARVYTSMTENFEYLNRARGLTGGGSGGGVSISAPEGSIAYVKEQITKTTEEWQNAITDAERLAAQKRLDVLNEELSKLQRYQPDALTPSGVGVMSLNNIAVSSLAFAPEIKERKQLGEVTEKAVDDIQSLAGVINDLGITSLFATAKIGKTTSIVGQMIGIFGQILSATLGGPWGAIVSSIGGLVGSFDTGGIVGGASYKGDRLTAQVSSGEMILNRQQQLNLLRLANGNSSVQVTSVAVSGDKLVLVINNALRGMGKSTIG